MGAKRHRPDGSGAPIYERRSWGRSQPIAVYLFALVLVILIPALIVSLVLLNRNNRAQEDVVRALTNATVQAMGQSVEREIASMITTLRVLSTSQALADGDLAQFHERASVALAGTGAFLVVLDGDFNQLLNTRVNYGEPLGPTSNVRAAAEAVERGTPMVSGLFFGQTAQRWVFNVLLPMPDNPATPVLVLTRNASNLIAALQSRLIDEGVDLVRIGYSDLIGAERGRDILVERLARTVGEGVSFCRSIYGTSPMGDVIDFEGGLSAGLPDLVAVPDTKVASLPRFRIARRRFPPSEARPAHTTG